GGVGPLRQEHEPGTRHGALVAHAVHNPLAGVLHLVTEGRRARRRAGQRAGGAKAKYALSDLSGQADRRRHDGGLRARPRCDRRGGAGTTRSPHRRLGPRAPRVSHGSPERRRRPFRGSLISAKTKKVAWSVPVRYQGKIARSSIARSDWGYLLRRERRQP